MTPNYSPPETLNNSNVEPSPKVDMWAIGIILYELLSKGKHPFKTD